LYRLDRDYPDAKWLHAYERLPQPTFFELLAAFKDDSFKDEREFRFVYHEDPRLFDNEVLKRAPKRFRMAGPLLVPYTTTKDLAGSRTGLSSAPETQLKIHEVVVGPHPLGEAAAAGVREFLDLRGYRDVSVARSRVPFR
jgi:hypothetical protein